MKIYDLVKGVADHVTVVVINKRGGFVETECSAREIKAERDDPFYNGPEIKDFCFSSVRPILDIYV